MIGGFDKYGTPQTNIQIVELNSELDSIQSDYSLGPSGFSDINISDMVFFSQSLADLIMRFQRDPQKFMIHSKKALRNIESSPI